MKGSNLHTEGRHDPGLGILPKTKNKIKPKKKKKRPEIMDIRIGLGHPRKLSAVISIL